MADIKMLTVKLGELKKKYAKLRIDHALSQLSDTSQLRKTRRSVARQFSLITVAMREEKAAVAASTKNAALADAAPAENVAPADAAPAKEAS